jgi:hypothetical protein
MGLGHQAGPEEGTRGLNETGALPQTGAGDPTRAQEQDRTRPLTQVHIAREVRGLVAGEEGDLRGRVNPTVTGPLPRTKEDADGWGQIDSLGAWDCGLSRFSAMESIQMPTMKLLVRPSLKDWSLSPAFSTLPGTLHVCWPHTQGWRPVGRCGGRQRKE